MQKILLTSILIATVAIPMRAAKQRSAQRGLQKTIVGFALFNLFYVFALIYLYPRI
jgi:hypothetical protein